MTDVARLVSIMYRQILTSIAGEAFLPLKSMTHGQCDARPTVTFPAAERHRQLAGTKLYCLVTEARECEQLTQSSCPAMHRPGVEVTTC